MTFEQLKGVNSHTLASSGVSATFLDISALDAAFYMLSTIIGLGGPILLAAPTSATGLL